MRPKLIKTETDYEMALTRVEKLMDAMPGTSAFDELEVLAALVNLYENEHHPIGPPDPIEAIRFRMEQSGLQQADLIPMTGSKSKVSEILNRKRPLSLNMIRELNSQLGISLRSLVSPARKFTLRQRPRAKIHPMRGRTGKMHLAARTLRK